MVRLYLTGVVLGLIITGCNNAEPTTAEEPKGIRHDSVRNTIIQEVETIRANDTMLVIPSLCFYGGDNEKYTARQYIAGDAVKMMKVEDFKDDYQKGTEIYYKDGFPIFVSEYTSDLSGEEEVYQETMIFIHNQSVYDAYTKDQFSEAVSFDDTAFKTTAATLNSIDFETPLRAIQQKGEFAMYFDEFLLIEPQSYLIVENADSSMNAAIYIKYGDSLLNDMFESPQAYEHKKIWVSHYFEDMNGIERMVYNGARLLED